MQKIIEYLIIYAVLVPEAYAQTSSGGKTLGDIIRTTWNTVIRPAIIFLFIAATVVFIWGIVEFILKADSEEGRKTGKSHIQWGLFGMFIMLVTGAIMVVLDNFFKSI